MSTKEVMIKREVKYARDPVKRRFIFNSPLIAESVRNLHVSLTPGNEIVLNYSLLLQSEAEKNKRSYSLRFFAIQ